MPGAEVVEVFAIQSEHLVTDGAFVAVYDAHLGLDLLSEVYIDKMLFQSRLAIFFRAKRAPDGGTV